MELNENIKGRYHFENGYGASVVCHPGSYGYADGLFELAVLHDGELCYNTSVADDVVGYQTDEGISDLLDEIASLPENDSCDHFSLFLRSKK